MLDVLIHSGTIMDGTGNVGYSGAVGISGDSLSVHMEMSLISKPLEKSMPPATSLALDLLIYIPMPD